MGRETSTAKSPNLLAVYAAADAQGIDLSRGSVCEDRLAALAVEGRPLDGLHLQPSDHIDGDQYMQVAQTYG